jgi:hypothetical protein
MIYVYLVCDFQLYCIPNDVYRPFRCRVYTNKAIDNYFEKLNFEKTIALCVDGGVEALLRMWMLAHYHARNWWALINGAVAGLWDERGRGECSPN